jgi:hypothetical protein
MTFGTRTIGAAIALVFAMSTIAFAQHGHSAGPHGTGKPAKTPSTAAPTPSGAATTSPIAAKIASHPKLAARLTPLLPKGTTLDAAATGFKNQGQFIAALHVSHNLGIPFASLKSEMTGDHPKSLGQAIHDLRPSTDAKAEAKKAGKQASDDVNASER